MTLVRVLSVSIPLPTGDGHHSMAPLARQLESLGRIGVDVERLEIAGSGKLKYPGAVPALWRRSRQVDVVHAHFGYAGWLARCQLGRPVVLSFMGSDLLGERAPDGSPSRAGQAVARLNRWFARTVDAVIVKSPEMARALGPVPCHLVPNGVDLDLFRPMERAEACDALGWPADRRRVLFPAKPANPNKGHPLAVAAVAALERRLGEPVELVALYPVPPDRVPLYMNACDAVILTSVHEGSPNVVKEAMACDRPVVSVPVGDVADLFEGATGYRVVPRSAEALAQALAELVEGSEPVTGRAAVRARGLELDAVARRLAGIYDEVTGSAGRGSTRVVAGHGTQGGGRPCVASPD